MGEIPYILEYRNKFFPWNGIVHCMGNKDRCDYLIEEGGVRYSWGKEPDALEYPDIKYLYLEPTSSQIKKSKFIIPKFISSLNNLRFLSLPITFVQNLQPLDIPQPLTTLMIPHLEQTPEKSNFSWPDVILNHLQAFVFFDSMYVSTLLKITHHFFPSLEYLECSIDKKGKVLEELSLLNNIKFLQTQNVWDINLFDFINAPLEALSITNSKANFAIENLVNIKSLKMLWLNKIKSVINCEIFTLLPDLIELTVIDSKKITNIEALLKCQKLRSIKFLNCGNPFKKEEKQMFMNKGFERLEIKFS